MVTGPSGRWSLLRRIATLALAATVLSGCVVVTPYHYHPFPYDYR